MLLMIRTIIVARSRVMVSVKAFHRWLNVRDEPPCDWVAIEDIADSQSQQRHEGGGGETTSAEGVVLELGMVHPKDALCGWI